MITVHNLHKTYGSKTVLAGVDASFPGGRLTSLIGPNGAGKTFQQSAFLPGPEMTF